ncbi:MAG TPA: chorismate mutase [Stellaceae bacterium]
MPESPPDLEQLRRRIDEIDDRLQDLLIERMKIVASVAEAKRSNGGAAAHQPAREAEIIRRLIGRSREFPPAMLVRMWRELLSATVRRQGDFAVAVYAPPEAPGYWDVARDHYGSHTPMLPCRSTAQVIRAVTDNQAAVGVLPMPQEGDTEPDPWWRHLMSSNDNAPHVIARLPFAARGNARSDGADALAIGREAEQETGRDRTLIATENSADVSRGRMISVFSGLGLSCRSLASCEHAEGINTLLEVEGFISRSDPRLDSFRTQLGPALYRALRLGGYAVPLSPAELGSATASAHSAAIGVAAEAL